MFILLLQTSLSYITDPSGNHSVTIPSRTSAAANAEVQELPEKMKLIKKSKKRGSYYKYTPKGRAQIAQYAKIYSVSAAKNVFSEKKH